MTAPLELAVVVPMYNEEPALRRVLVEWRETLAAAAVRFRFVVIDDGSTDGSVRVAEDLMREFPREIVLIRQANAGHGAACRQGYEAAVASGAGWVLQIDSDGQCDPVYFDAFWTARATSDCVFGRRVIRDDGVARALVGRLCSTLVALRTRHLPADVNVPYRLIRGTVLASALSRVPGTFGLQNIALTVVLLRTAHIRWTWIPIRFRTGYRGASRLRLPALARMGWGLFRDLPSLRS